MEKDEELMFALTNEYRIRNLVHLLNSNWLPTHREKCSKKENSNSGRPNILEDFAMVGQY